MPASIVRAGRREPNSMARQVSIHAARSFDPAWQAESEARRELVQRRVLEKMYNTDYAAAWYLRGHQPCSTTAAIFDRISGLSNRLEESQRYSRSAQARRIGAGEAPSTTFHLGDAAVATDTLLMDVGNHVSGSLLAKSITAGPVLKSSMQPPVFQPGTPQSGVNGWYAVWYIRRCRTTELQTRSQWRLQHLVCRRRCKGRHRHERRWRLKQRLSGHCR